MFKSFTDMEVWKLSHHLSIQIFKLTKNLPRSEDYALTSQIRRSATSVSANIAEGFGRNTSKDKSHFYTISRGSAYETESHLIYGKDVHYFDAEKVTELIIKYDELIHQLNKIMKSLN